MQPSVKMIWKLEMWETNKTWNQKIEELFIIFWQILLYLWLKTFLFKASRVVYLIYITPSVWNISEMFMFLGWILCTLNVPAFPLCLLLFFRFRLSVESVSFKFCLPKSKAVVNSFKKSLIIMKGLYIYISYVYNERYNE